MEIDEGNQQRDRSHETPSVGSRLELQDQLARVAASVPGVIFSTRLRPDGRILMPYASQALEALSGLKLKDVVDDFSPILDRVHMEDVSGFQEAMAESARSMNPFRCTFRYAHPTKGELCVEGHAMPSREADGSTLWHGYAQDITERKRVEEALAESERRHRVIAEDIPILICRFTPTGEITHVNEAYCRFFSKTREELVGRSFLELVPTEDRGRVMAGISALTAKSPTMSHEHQVVAPGGKIKWQRWTNQALLDPKGRVVGYQSIGDDITDRRRAEEKLYAIQQRLRAVMVGLPVGIAFSRDTDCRTIEQNPALLSLFEATPEDNLSASASDPGATGRKVRYFQDGRELSDAELPLQRAVAEQASIPALELEVELPDGRRWLAEVSGAPIRDQRGEVIGGVAVVADITERKRAEQALLDADRRKNEFLALLGHELRNPLAPIRNAIHVLSGQESLPEDVRWAVNLIGRQSERLEQLVNDLLDVARITSGRVQLRKAPVTVRDAIEDALQSLSHMIEKRGQIVIKQLPDAPALVMADPLRLDQIFANLLHNAVKYTRKGDQIRVIVTREDMNVVVRIQDDGMGICSERFPRLFDVFSSGETVSPGDPDFEGLGVGLPLAKQLTEAHGGTLVAHSKGPGRGSEFVVTLPLHVEAEGRSCAKAAIVPDTKRSFRSRRVLVVDDNLDVAESFKVLLQSMGHQVRALNAGGDALAVVLEWQPDVVFLDIAMPDMDGYEVAASIHAAELSPRPFIAALTGYGQDSLRTPPLEAGFDHHLLKPADPAHIKALLAGLD